MLAACSPLAGMGEAETCLRHVRPPLWGGFGADGSADCAEDVEILLDGVSGGREVLADQIALMRREGFEI